MRLISMSRKLNERNMCVSVWVWLNQQWTHAEESFLYRKLNGTLRNWLVTWKSVRNVCSNDQVNRLFLDKCLSETQSLVSWFLSENNRMRSNESTQKSIWISIEWVDSRNICAGIKCLRRIVCKTRSLPEPNKCQKLGSKTRH